MKLNSPHLLNDDCWLMCFDGKKNESNDKHADQRTVGKRSELEPTIEFEIH